MFANPAVAIHVTSSANLISLRQESCLAKVKQHKNCFLSMWLQTVNASPETQSKMPKNVLVSDGVAKLAAFIAR